MWGVWNQGQVPTERIIVNQSNVGSTLGGVIDSTKLYFIDGIVDCSGVSVEIPSGGISIKGYTFDISKLTCSEENHTMFTSLAGGSGNVIGVDFAIEITGAGSKVYDLISATGFDAFEFTRINYNDCTSLGVVDNYRQGLEVGTGRFGGTPELELKGTWVGGYFIDTSVVRSLLSGSYSLFKAGAGFSMLSRFRSNQNIDLPAGASFVDFSQANFENPSTLQLTGCIITRDGISDPSDSNITPNIGGDELASSWTGCKGITNTFVGGSSKVSTEVLTNISGGLPSIIEGVFVASGLQHFDSPSNGKLRHLGDNPIEYRVDFDFVLDGGANDDYAMQLFKNDGSDSQIYQQIRVVNNLSGGRDVAYFTGVANAILNKNDYLFWKVQNLSDNSNCTLELDSSWSVEER